MVSGFDWVENPSVRIRTDKHTEKLSKLETEETTFTRKDPQELLSNRLWIAGHATIFLCSVPSIFFCLTWQTSKWIPRLLYKFTFLTVIAVNGTYVYKILDGEMANLYSVLPMRMFQRFVLAIVWLITPPQTINVIPFMLFALFYLTHDSNKDLMKISALAAPAKQIHQQLSKIIVPIVSYLDIILFFQLLLNIILFRRFSIIAMAVFLFIYRIRLMFSPPAYNALVTVANKLDSMISKPSTPEKVRSMWNMVKIRFRAIDLNHSELHNEVTDDAIVRANLFNSLEK